MSTMCEEYKAVDIDNYLRVLRLYFVWKVGKLVLEISLCSATLSSFTSLCQ